MLSRPSIHSSPIHTGSLGDVVSEWLRKLKPDGVGVFRVAVDISSLSRMLMAAVVSTCLSCSGELGRIDVTFIYAPAKHTSPSDRQGPITKFGAVLPEFAGLSEASRGLAAVIGLGYEPDLALATQQGLDPATSWLLTPTGVDRAFDVDVADANSRVISLNDVDQVLVYNVLRPFDLFMKLESVVAGLARTHNVVLVPFGPKILALVSLLVALEHSPDVGVWRVSAGRLGPIRDAKADGRLAAVQVIFESNAAVSSELDGSHAEILHPFTSDA